MKQFFKKIASVLAKIYNKIAPVMAKIGKIGLILGLVLLVGSKLYASGLEADQVWPKFYAAWATLIGTYLSIVMAVVYVLFDIRNLWSNHIRKGIVSLKRSPSTIPLVMMLVTFMFYSLNLTDVSNTTAKIYGKGMGLCEFCIMLLSLLNLVCMLNAFPRRKKPNIPMIVLMFAMFGIIIFCDVHYSGLIMAAITRAENPIVINEDTAYIAKAYNMLNVHMILTIVCGALVVLMPVYGKLLRLINTSVDIEENANMAQIDIHD